MAAGFGRHGMPPPASNPDLWPIDLETGMRVASKAGDLSSKFGHAKPLGSRIIRYVRTDRQKNGRTRATVIVPSLRAGHNNNTGTMFMVMWSRHIHCDSLPVHMMSVDRREPQTSRVNLPHVPKPNKIHLLWETVYDVTHARAFKMTQKKV